METLDVTPTVCERSRRFAARPSGMEESRISTDALLLAACFVLKAEKKKSPGDGCRRGFCISAD
jgi:hypothetical protein